MADHKDLPLPKISTEGSAGMDLYAAIREPLSLQPGARELVPTGLGLAIPTGYEGQVRPRSGLAVRFGLSIVNSPGTIDSDYRGEIKVPLINLGSEPMTINRGERIAQLVIAPVPYVKLKEVSELSKTSRGDGGFGSTGR